MAHSEDLIEKTMKDYEHFPLMSTKAIARKHGVSPSTVLAWAEERKLKRRPRGRRKQLVPSASQLRIIKLRKVLTLEQIADKEGCSKQAIHRTVKRWSAYVEKPEPPFAPGDVVSRDGKKYTVLVANQHDGAVLDSKGRQILRFGWRLGSAICVKIGHNSRYAGASATGGDQAQAAPVSG